jgi:hypothetical protein
MMSLSPYQLHINKPRNNLVRAVDAMKRNAVTQGQHELAEDDLIIDEDRTKLVIYDGGYSNLDDVIGRMRKEVNVLHLMV